VRGDRRGARGAATDRARLAGLTDEQLHELLPTAIERHAASHGTPDITPEAPVLLFADHFRG
jgi:hypothetical protein